MTSGSSDSGSVDQGQEQIQHRLLQRVAAGDLQAFTQLYDEFSGLMFSLALRILRDRSQAEDVLQDVFLQIWNRAESYNSQLGKPITWMITLTRNRAIDRLRSNARGQRLIEAALEHGIGTPQNTCGSLESALRHEAATGVRRAMTQLPPEQREAIELAFFAGLTQTEVASALRQPLGTIKARIRRGMIRLRDLLEEVELNPSKTPTRGTDHPRNAAYG